MDITQKAMSMEKRFLERKAEHQELEEVIQQEISRHQDVSKRPAPAKGLPSTVKNKRLVETKVKAWLDNRLTNCTIVPNNEFPSFFARNPIFLPVPRREQKKLLGDSGFYSFDTPWGKGHRSGAFVDTFDEDVLFALTMQESEYVIGDANKFPIRLEEHGEHEVATRVIVCSIIDIIRFLGLTSNGRIYKRIYESLIRLDSVYISVEKFSKNTGGDFEVKAGEYMDKRKFPGGIRLVRLCIDTYEKEGVILAQLDPYFAYWLRNEYFHMNWSIRKQLTNTGKAIFRFLQSHRNSNMPMKLSTIRNAIGYVRDMKYFKRDLKGCCETLIENGWLDFYEISGNNRSSEYKLKIVRKI